MQFALLVYGTTVRLKDGKRRVQDGPIADSKEQLGGFTILELGSGLL
jgi:hypothetical protein